MATTQPPDVELNSNTVGDAAKKDDNSCEEGEGLDLGRDRRGLRRLRVEEDQQAAETEGGRELNKARARW